MPLLDPRIQNALNEAGLGNTDKAESLTDRMDRKGLGMERLLENLAAIAETSQSDHLRMRAIENALKMHGALKDQAAPIPQISIVIKDPSMVAATAESNGINPILLPRQMIFPKESNEVN